MEKHCKTNSQDCATLECFQTLRVNPVTSDTGELVKLFWQATTAPSQGSWEFLGCEEGITRNPVVTRHEVERLLWCVMLH